MLLTFRKTYRKGTDDRMNIGIVTTWFERGAAYVSKAYMDVLSEKHDVFIYARAGEMQSKRDPVWDLPNVTWAPRLAGPFCDGTNAISRFHFLKWLRTNRIQIIFFNEQRENSIVKEVSGLGYVTGAYVDYYTKNTVSDFDTYDFLICNTKRHYSVFKEHRNCLFLQWGTEIDVFHPDASRPLFKDCIVFFHSAGMAQASSMRKGTDLLVHAFQHVTGSVRLLIHSQVALSQYGDEIKSIVENDTRIEFIEKTVSAPGLYHLGDVYVYPSRLEGIGLTIPEALASGLPVITTNEMPMNEFVREQYNGLLVEVSSRRNRGDGYYWPESIVNIFDLTKKMQEYVNNRQLVYEHSTNARASAVQLYNWIQNSEGLADWFAELTVGEISKNIGIRRFVTWCLVDLFIIAQGGATHVVKYFVPSKRARRLLKRIIAGCISKNGSVKYFV